MVDQILQDTSECRAIVEYGCGSGLQTIYWGVAMAIRRGDVYVSNPRRPAYAAYWPANVKFYKSEGSMPALDKLVGQRLVIVIVDGGERLPIVFQCAESAVIGSILLIHDWIVRKYPEFIADANKKLIEHGWEQIEVETASIVCSRFAVWRRVWN